MIRFIGFAAAMVCVCSIAVGQNNFQPTMATYLGGTESVEEWTCVDVAPDGHVVAAGMAPGYSVDGVQETWLMAGGDGIVLRVDPKNNEVVSVTRIGDWIEDMEIGPDGRIAITGSFGVAVLSPDASKIVWRDGDIVRGTRAAQFRNQTPPFKKYRYTRRVARVSVGEDGTVASFQAERKDWGDAPKHGRLYVWNRDGERLCDLRMTKYKYPKDLAVDSANKQVIVGGFNTYSHDSPHMKDHPIHMQFLTAFTYDGTVNWAAYDFPAKDVYAENTYADSRVQRLAIGADGYLYMGGYIHGGDYIWKHHPFDVKKRVQVDVGYDGYTMAANMGKGIDQSYFAKYDPKSGEILQGQVLLCRERPDGGGKPTQIQIKGIDADEDGNVYIAGYCEAYIKDRDKQRVAGEQVGEYHAPEVFLLSVTPDFSQRRVWTVFSREDCEAAAWALAVRNGWGAFVGEVYQGEVITTDNALQTAPAEHTDGYLVIWETE
ncbi:MAG: SBBP repeat-containing protein [Phycisphaerae bacterium]